MKPQLKIAFLMLMFFPEIALSQTIKVTAEYKPASYEAGGGRFVSTTPCNKTASGMWLTYCRGEITSLDSLLFSISYGVTRAAKKSVENPKDSIVYMQSFSQKEMTVTSANGISYRVLLVPEMLGAHFDASIYHDTAKPIYNEFTKPIGGCSYLDKQVAGHTQWQAWMVLWGEVAGKSCYTALSTNVGVTVKALFFGFKIKPPSPLDMPNGVYNGSIKLLVSSNGDISLGNGTYSDTSLIIDLTLTVRHQLKVDFPKGSGDGYSQVTLLPPGGWRNWMHNGKREPSILQQDLPFRIWFSAPFTVSLRCQHQWGTECGLKDSKGRTVPLKTYYVNSINEMTLLTTNKYNFVLPVQGKPIINAARAIRFQVVGGTVAEMMKYPGSSFKGDVTLIFDAAID